MKIKNCLAFLQQNNRRDITRFFLIKNYITMTRITSKHYSNETILKVWQKAEIVEGFNSHEIRRDVCGALIQFDLLETDHKIHGWKIDCIKPLEYGGDYSLQNLQPLNWKNKASKKNNYPSWDCSLVFSNYTQL